jgi:hypothetical protein
VKKGILIDLVTAVDRLYQTQGVEISGSFYKGKIISARIYPFQRSIMNVQLGNTDFYLPYLVDQYISADFPKEELGIAYSSTNIGYANFPLYATKEFAALLPEFEDQMGKKISQLSISENYNKFDDFIRQKQITIEVDRAHAHPFPFITSSSTHTLFSLKKLASCRIDAYIHNMHECDMELRANTIDTSNMEKNEFMKTVGRMIIPATEKGHETDRIISGIVWKLQGREASDAPHENTFWSGPQKEVL